MEEMFNRIILLEDAAKRETEELIKRKNENWYAEARALIEKPVADYIRINGPILEEGVVIQELNSILSDNTRKVAK